MDIKELKNKKGIYKLSINNHIYIGSSNNLGQRLKKHIMTLSYGYHDNQYLQRCFNKYGSSALKWEIVEIVDIETTREDLLKLEKHYIEIYNADLNLKKDPTTEYNCITTSIKVYQFNLFGDLLKEWPSMSEAARFYNISPSNIRTCATNRKRQRTSSGFLWGFNPVYDGDLYILYVYDLNGNLLSRHSSTVEIYETYFSEQPRKDTLSVIKTKINKSPYKFIYINTNKDFKPDPNYKPRYRDKTDIEKRLEENPIVYVYNKDGELLYSKRYNDFDNKSYIRIALHKTGSHKLYYSLENNIGEKFYKNYNAVNITAINIETQEKQSFTSAVECSWHLFSNRNDSKNILKHIKRNTPFKGYIFKRDC